MLCLQQVKRLTVEGNSFKVPGNVWLFQLVMKRETRCSKSESKLWIRSGTAPWTSGNGLCNQLSLFPCITSWSLLQVWQESLLRFPCFDHKKVWIPAATPHRHSANGEPHRTYKLWQDHLPLLHCLCTWDTNISLICLRRWSDRYSNLCPIWMRRCW